MPPGAATTALGITVVSTNGYGVELRGLPQVLCFFQRRGLGLCTPSNPHT